MKKLLIALFAVAGLALVPAAEARRCGRGGCAPKVCAAPCAPDCKVTEEIVGYRYEPCCRMVKEEGYKRCPIKETTKCCTTRSSRCCKDEMSCCIFPESSNFKQEELDQAHGRADGVASDMQ